MAPRAYWKGFLRLSLVTCPIALFPATSESEKISFNQINRNTGHRIKYQKVDADTGEEVSNDDIIKGYKVDTDTYLEVSKEELENISLESTRTILMRRLSLALGLLAACAATGASAETVNLTGTYRCIQMCRNGMLGAPTCGDVKRLPSKTCN